MRDDDDIIEAYERELDPGEDEPVDLVPFDDDVPRRQRGFWLVAGSIAVCAVILVTAILANVGVKDTIAHAQHSLRVAETAADQILTRAGSFALADAEGLAMNETTLTYVEGDDESGSLDEVSVASSAAEWAAAVQVRPGACFYLRRTISGEVYYGTGTVCTGFAAADSIDPRW